ncbi:DUF4097 domain-containing protein [Paenibacillus puldeungensis]|uniref:DUF4097 domain-containing protein n=1 Tax=Paenibacillus puldeungensis TaxID=696536 RepID=A0ABW3S3A6_9BACL
MSSKKWSILAIILILLGLAGATYNKFEFGDDYPSFHQKWTFDQDALKALSIDSSYDVDMEFIKSPDGTNYVEVSGNMKQQTINKIKQAKISSQTLELPMNDDFYWSFLTISFQSTKQHIVVALANPNALDRIDFKARSNNGHFTGLQGKKIHLTTISGNLHADSIVADELKLSATSGEISASQIQGDTDIGLSSGNIRVETLSGSLQAKTTSGNITAEGVTGNVDASVGSGNIRFTNFTGDGTFHSMSGNVTLMDQRSDNLDIRVGSGNVSLSSDPDFKGTYDLRASSGNVTAPESPGETSDIIKARSVSGNIKVK